MKFKFDIECTAEEARQFFGLPDVAPMQERLMDDLESRLHDNLKNMEPEKMMSTWLPATIQSWAEMQKMFWSQSSFAGGSEDESKDD